MTLSDDVWNASCAKCGEGCSLTDMVSTDGTGMSLICKQCAEETHDESD